ncbi:phosphotransferase [Cellulomonas aerilata]|uniref:Aminoglycoside phosphotransferase domain-containing protein n=1 Tax=Cellulomonas aerilata TaxID=515326 RepID=A0A512D7P1_9CELL|nr:phosphotransferase [Cellulomonas aerilata]GEO32496.1 hypothetical protein CAE01nite_02210 [Cellulomonas aerilata]
MPQYPLPDRVGAEEVLAAAARRTAALHDAARGLDRSGAVWQPRGHEPAEVVCHNDLAPDTMVLDGGRLVGIIDWDTASPGPRVWDLAYLAYRLVPLSHPDHDGLRLDRVARARRLRVLCDALGHDLAPPEVLRGAVVRLEDLAAWTLARATADDDDRLRGHVDLYRRDARWIGASCGVLAEDRASD